MTLSYTTSATAAVTAAAKDGTEGAWIGIDLGTSNCACAVWDSTRGRPKLLQLAGIAKPRKGKVGRIVPSCVLLFQGEQQPAGGGDTDVQGASSLLCANTPAVVGYPVLERLEHGGGGGNSSTSSAAPDIMKACVTSIKRLVGIKNLNHADDHFIQSLPFHVVEEDDGSLSLSVIPLNTSRTIHVTPLEILTTILISIRIAAEQYLVKQTYKKDLKIPGSSTVITNVVIGVPAHFGQAQRSVFVDACRAAGFTGHVSTLTESTAASMAYGLFVSVPTEKHILVLDMGGGTTDVTIAKVTPNNNQDFSVLTTEGDSRLGGDDMDEALLRRVMERTTINIASTSTTTTNTITTEARRQLLIACRKCKEALCGTEEDKPCAVYNLPLPNSHKPTAAAAKMMMMITEADFNNAIAPLLDRVQQLIRNVVQRSGVTMDEVVLVGGATRVPAVQKMLRNEFPTISDLCSSLHAEGAVAQGAAIQAAIRSGLVPISELKSAMMLDALPHPIGVLSPDQKSYIPILARDSQLPAMGYASFTLADPRQAGVTVIAVEDVGDSLEKVGEFTFLLRRLSPHELNALDGARTVDIGMTMEQSGEFIVSIFDEHDPEHIRKKQRYQQLKGGELGYDVEIKEESIPLSLIVACIILFLLYIGVKLAFHDPEESGATII